MQLKTIDPSTGLQKPPSHHQLKPVQATGLEMLSWALHQPVTQIIQLRGFHRLQKGSPGYSIIIVFISRTCLDSPIDSGYSAKVEQPGARQNNPLDPEISVRGSGSQAGEGKGTGRAVPPKSYFFITSPFRQQEKVTEA